VTLMLDLDAYAAKHFISTRTVRRYLDADEIPGAQKVGGKWAIPADAVRVTRTTTVAKATPAAATPPPATVTTILDAQPVFLDLDTAARLLGVTVHAVKSDPDYFHLVRKGHRGAWVMPKYRMRQLEG
jgi:hypothetical protein